MTYEIVVSQTPFVSETVRHEDYKEESRMTIPVTTKDENRGASLWLAVATETVALHFRRKK